MLLTALRGGLLVAVGGGRAGGGAGLDARRRVGADAGGRHDHDAAAARLEPRRLDGPRHDAGASVPGRPPLEVVAAWDADAGAYAWARRGGAVPPALEQITRGQGLFLWLSGTRTAQWTRPASAEGSC